MPLSNTRTHYGSVAKVFHWLTALLILTAIPLGVVSQNMPFATSEELAAKAQLFSIHKTVGVMAFFVAVLRILWALVQTKPAGLHPDRRLETFAAETVHWALYISLALVPLSGWLHHAATEGFAPILWPFGQSLPFVPKDPDLAEVFGTMHWLFTKVLLASIILHVAGALKHVVIDRDATLRRMWFGQTDVVAPDAPHPLTPALAAIAIWVGAIGVGFALANRPEGTDAPLASVASEWRVTEGDLTFSVVQMGAEVEGRFDDWTAVISFSPETGTGTVTTQIAVTSLTLGSVTDQALGPEFFDASAHPAAIFTADIRPHEDDYIADGTLTLRGIEVPVLMPFTLSLEGETATMEGSVTLDRRRFEMGASYADESQVGFVVNVTIALTATR